MMEIAMIKRAEVRILLVVIDLLLGVSLAQSQSSARFKAVAFDYFVIFDPNSVIPEVEKAFPGKGAEFTRLWRAKQFEYGFLRSITNRHADFFKVSEDALRKLKAAGVQIITIANFSQKMLRANADRAGIAALFDELLSTEINGTYKPDPRAYELGMKRLNLKKSEILFVAFGGWDAYGAKSFGYKTYWMNRFKLPVEQLGIQPDMTSNDMEGLLNVVL